MRSTAIRVMARLVIAVSVLAGGRLAAVEAPAEAPGAKLAPELDAIPRDAVSVISIRMAALRDNKPGQWLFDLLSNDPAFKQMFQGQQAGVGSWPDFDKKMASEMGIDGDTIDRVTFVVTRIDLAKVAQQGDNVPLGSVLSLRKPYDRAKVLKVLVPNATEEKVGKHVYFHDKGKHLGVHFLNDRSFVTGTESALKEILSQPEKKLAGPIAGVLALAAESALLVHVNPETLGPIAGVFLLAGPAPEPWNTILRQFLDLKGFTFCVDIEEQLRLDLLLHCANERDQKEVVDSVRKGIDLGAPGLAAFIAAGVPKEAEPYLPLLKGTATALKHAEVREEGLHLHVPLYIRPETGKPEKKVAPPLTDKRLEEIWTGFTRQGIVGVRGSYRDAHLLAAAPEQALKLLKERVKPSPAMDAAERKTIETYLGDLDSEEFDRREKATLELIKLGSRARPTIQARLDGELKSLEVRRRLERIMEKLKGGLSPEEQRGLRALEVLEQIGTPEAKQLMRTIGEGEPGVPLTRDARKRLARMK